jgi:hypothetical protein
LWHYEFAQYLDEMDESRTHENEKIAMQDFGKSILICMPFKKYNMYVKRIEEKISLEAD